MSQKVTEKKTKKKLDLDLDIFNAGGKKVGKYRLDSEAFDGKVSATLVHQAVVAYLANQRKGLAKTKTRGQVRGGGRKPWRQKGTGRARAGSIRSPIWRGGGITFGPQPRSYNQALPKKMKVLALKSALNAKLQDNQIVVLDEIALKTHKTKEFCKAVAHLKLSKDKIRLVVEKLENNLKLATSNLKKISAVKASDLTTIDVVNCKKLVLTKAAIKEIEERIKKTQRSKIKNEIKDI